MTAIPKSLSLFSMAGKVCVVTGAARGLGLEFCRAFIDAGCTKVAILDLKETESNEAGTELKEYFAQTYPDSAEALDILGLGCDVSSEQSVKDAFEKVASKFGSIDAVVASAGIVHSHSALEYPAEKMKLLYDINVHGSFYTAREAAKHMTPKSKGSIVLISSMSANIINIPQMQTPYNGSKAAVKHMAASLAVEWAKTGIRVNTLAPGYMLTKLTRTVLANDPAMKETWEKLTPMGRIGLPEDLSGAIIYLCSDASQFMTGSEIRVDGGYCCV